MRSGQTDRPLMVAVAHATAPRPAVGPRDMGDWDARLFAGLRVAAVPSAVRGALASALGEVGVEAEHFFALLRSFGGLGIQPHARGEVFLLRLEAAARRLYGSGAALEVATQSYLTALEAAYPGLSREARVDEVWWPQFYGEPIPGEALELRLRRCGYAYRHVVAAHLSVSVEAIAEHLAIVLHALRTLPPAGVVPADALYAGLYELSSGLQGYVIPTHVASMDARAPGLLLGIQRLRTLDAREDTSLASDIAWARAQYAQARSMQGGGDSAAESRANPWRWGASPLRDWQHVLADLESLQAQASVRRSS